MPTIKLMDQLGATVDAEIKPRLGNRQVHRNRPAHFIWKKRNG